MEETTPLPTYHPPSKDQVDTSLSQLRTHKVLKRHVDMSKWIELALIENKEERLKRLVQIFESQVQQDATNDYYKWYDNSGYDYDHV